MKFTLNLFHRIPMLRAIGRENVRFALGAIAAHRLRSFLTLLGIVIGVAPVIALVAIMTGFNAKVEELVKSFGATTVTFSKYEDTDGAHGRQEILKRRPLTLEDAKALQRMVPTTVGVSPERNETAGFGDTTVKNTRGDEANSPQIGGVLPSYATVRSQELQDGRFFSDSESDHKARVCVIGTDVANALYPGRDPIQKTLFIRGESFTVVGLLKKKGSLMGESADNLLLIPFGAFDDLFPAGPGGDDGLTISLAARNPLDHQTMIDQAQTVLRIRRGLKANQPNDFGWSSAEGELQKFNAIFGAVAAGVIFIAGLALLVGGVGVMNIMLVSVTERTREIGVRKALGATRKDIAGQFLMEAITLTGVGGAIGLAGGLGVALLVRLATELPASAPLWTLFLGFGMSTAIGIAFGLWPAMRAAKQDPIEALRYE